MNLKMNTKYLIRKQILFKIRNNILMFRCCSTLISQQGISNCCDLFIELGGYHFLPLVLTKVVVIGLQVHLDQMEGT